MKVMNPIQLSLSLAGIAVRSQRLMVNFLTRHHELGGLGDPAGLGQAFLDLTAKMIADPMSIAQTQLKRRLRLYQAKLFNFRRGNSVSG
jgi:polyhydroxyalkanoate synthase